MRRLNAITEKPHAEERPLRDTACGGSSRQAGASRSTHGCNAVLLFVFYCGGHVRLALFEPDIPQNTGALLRLAACFGVAVDLIEPLGFLLDDRRLKRAALDYAALLTLRRHASWASFLAERDPGSRLILLTTHGTISLHGFAFAASDTLLLGRESAGVPGFVHEAAMARVVIP